MVGKARKVDLSENSAQSCQGTLRGGKETLTPIVCKTKAQKETLDYDSMIHVG